MFYFITFYENDELLRFEEGRDGNKNKDIVCFKVLFLI